MNDSSKEMLVQNVVLCNMTVNGKPYQLLGENDSECKYQDFVELVEYSNNVSRVGESKRTWRGKSKAIEKMEIVRLSVYFFLFDCDTSI